MNWYLDLVVAQPIITAIIQFAVLGTLGDAISHWIVKRRIFSPYDLKTFILKSIEWSILAVMTKYAFIGFHGFVESLINNNYLPHLEGITKSFAISTSMNLQFGPLLVITHRLMDNLIAGKQNWKNLDKIFILCSGFGYPHTRLLSFSQKNFKLGWQRYGLSP